MPVTSHGGPQTVPTGNGANDENDESNYDGDGDVDGESDGEDEEVDEDADEGISDECSDDELVPLATVQNPSRDVRVSGLAARLRDGFSLLEGMSRAT